MLVGGCTCQPKRVDDFFPETVAHIGMKGEEVNHKRQKGGRLRDQIPFSVQMDPGNPKLSAYGISRCDKESDQLIANVFNICGDGHVS